MATIIKFETPVDVNKTQMLDYYVNVYSAENQFVVGIRYKGYSGHAFCDELKGLESIYPNCHLDY